MGIGCSTSPKTPQGGESETVPLVGSLKAYRYRLANGLKLIVVPEHSSPTIAYQTWFNVGSRNEQKGRTGLAHLFEHMMFKGTKTHPEGIFDRVLESAGAEGLNAFTSRDYTAYVQELPKDKLELVAKMESDRMVNLIVDEKAFKTETEVVQNERRMRVKNSPDGTLYETVFDVAFKTHPYHWPVIGYEEDLNAMGAEDARKFYGQFYAPNHATIVVVGDIDPNQVLDTVTRYYGGLNAQPEPSRAVPVEAEQKEVRRKTLKLDIQVEKLMIAYHIPEVTDADAGAIEVVRNLLSSGRSSRLHRALVETGIATSVGSFSLDDRDPSLMIIAANLQKGRKAAQAETVILKELQRVWNEPISAQEMERIRNTMSYDFFDGMSSNTDKAGLIGKYETITGRFEKALDIFQNQMKVTPEEMQRVAKKYLVPTNRSVIAGVPK